METYYIINYNLFLLPKEKVTFIFFLITILSIPVMFSVDSYLKLKMTSHIYYTINTISKERLFSY